MPCKLYEKTNSTPSYQSEFAKQEMEFLGHIVTPTGLKVDPKKVEAITNWPTPKTVPDLRSFLGHATFYRRFVEGFYRTAAPMTDLLKKDKNFDWNQEHQESFQGIKKALTTSPVLVIADPRPEWPIHIKIDASGFCNCSKLVSRPRTWITTYCIRVQKTQFS